MRSKGITKIKGQGLHLEIIALLEQSKLQSIWNIARQ